MICRPSYNHLTAASTFYVAQRNLPTLHPRRRIWICRLHRLVYLAAAAQPFELVDRIPRVAGHQLCHSSRYAENSWMARGQPGTCRAASGRSVWHLRRGAVRRRTLLGSIASLTGTSVGLAPLRRLFIVLPTAADCA